MRKARHATRRQETRRRLELGEAVEAAGAGHLARNEIIEALSAHVGRRSDRNRGPVEVIPSANRQPAVRKQVS